MTDSPYRATKLVTQAKLFTIAKTLGAAVALGYQFLLVRHLSVPDYVSFTILTAVNAILAFCTMFGMDRLTYRYMPPMREAGRWREMLLFMGGLLLLRQVTMLVIWFIIGWLCVGMLPKQIGSEILRLPWHYVGFAVAVAFTDSISTFCNSLGLQGRQAMLMLAMTLLRFALSAVLIYGFGGLDAVQISTILVGTEFLLAAGLTLSLAMELAPLARVRPVPPIHFGIAWRSVAVESLSTQLAYMLTLPFRGGLMKVFVGAVASPVVTASFGFFQTIADRVYQLLPVFMMKGFVEPALANDYAKRQDMGRVQLTVSLLLRLNFVILMLALAILLGCGEPLINLVTRDRYGSQVLVAGLLLLQMAGMTIGEALWMAVNPVGRILYHNRVWVWVSVLCYGVMALAAAAHSPELLIIVSALPYGLVYAWLRWGSHEPVMQQGLGFGWFWQLAIPVVLAAAAARLVLWGFGNSPVVVVAAAVAAVACFILVLRRLTLVSAADSADLTSMSPRLVRMLRLFTTVGKH